MLLSRLEEHASERGERTALVFGRGGNPLTYVELWDLACRRGALLRDEGVEPGELLLLFGPCEPETVLGFLGAMVCGAVPSFMALPSSRQDPAHYWEQHAALLRHLGRGTVLIPEDSGRELAAACPDNPLRILSLDDEAAGAPMTPVRRNESDVALLQHSSGTTGLKKGVALSFRQIEDQVEAYADRLQLGPDARIASWLPLYHDMGLIACLLLPLTLGLEASYVSPFQWVARPALLLDLVESRKATHVWLPNFAFHHLVQGIRRSGQPRDLSSVEAWVNCSEPCKPAAFDIFLSRWEPQGVRPESLGCCYAMAETVFAVSQTPPGRLVRRVMLEKEGFGSPGEPVRTSEDGIPLLSSGPPLDGVQIRIAGAPGDSEPVYGEIEVAAPFLFDGYNKDPERSAAALNDGFYRTGDVGFLLDGELYVCGRLDDMIIVNGRNLYAHQVEQVVSAVDGVAPGRVVAFPVEAEETGSQRLVIVAEQRGESDPTPEILQEVIDAIGVMPDEVRLVPPKTIVKTTSGKVDRVTNRRRYLEGSLESWGERPDTATQKAKKRLIVVSGNCQSSHVAHFLRSLPEIAADTEVRVFGDNRPRPEATRRRSRQPEGADLLRCLHEERDRIVAVVRQSSHGWYGGDETFELPDSAVSVRYPVAMANYLWPLAEPDARFGAGAARELKAAFPGTLCDRLLARLLAEGVPESDVVEAYLSHDIDDLVDLDRLKELNDVSMGRLEADASFGVWDFAQERIAEQQMFRTSLHPSGTLLAEVLRGIADRLPFITDRRMVEYQLERVAAGPGIQDHDAPVHPQIVERFDLAWARPNRYRFWDEGEYSFEEHLLRLYEGRRCLAAIEAGAAERSGDLERARDLMTTAVEQVSRSAVYRGRLAALLTRLGDKEAALEQRRAAYGLEPSPRNALPLMRGLFNAGLDSEASALVDEVERAFGQDETDVVLLRQELLVRSGEPAEAARLLAATDSLDYRVWLALGQARYRLGEYDEAEAAALRAHELSAWSPAVERSVNSLRERITARRQPAPAGDAARS